MKKIFQPLCLLILFSVIYYGCRKDTTPSGTVFTPYADVINPPDSFIYYIPLSYNSVQQGKIKFSEDAVWQITKTAGIGASTWLSRSDVSSIYNIILKDTVALQGNYLYLLTASNATSPDGVKIFVNFKKTDLNYQSYSKKY